MNITKKVAICISLVVIPISTAVQASAEVSHTLNFSISDLTFGGKNGYAMVDLAGCNFYIIAIGEPRLPFKQIRLVIPRNVEISKVTITDSTSQLIKGSYFIYPVQPPIEIGPGSSTPDFVPPDSMVYSSTSLYPQHLVEVVSQGYMCGVHLVTLRISPLRYFPARRQLSLYSKISFTLNFAPSEDEIQPILKRSLQIQERVERVIRDLVDNPKSIDDFVNTSIPLEKRSLVTKKLSISSLPSPEDHSVPFVIITSEALKPEFQRLANSATRKGWPTEPRTIGWISSHYGGCDLQEKVRNFIKDAYSKWETRGVLLGGDTQIVPPRMGYTFHPYSDWTHLPTDFYYSALDGSWNYDGDSDFGDSDADDYYPDLVFGIGRASVEDTTETRIFVDKILKYEKDPDLAYLNRVLLMGASILNGCSDSLGQDLKDTIDCYIPNSFQVYKLYSHYDQYGGDADLNRSNAVDRLNMGYHLVNHFDHSSPYTLGTGIKCHWGSERLMGLEDVDGLANRNKFSILLSFTCSSNDFTKSSLSEHMMSNPQRGCLAFIGNTRITWWEDRGGDVEFFRVLFDSQMPLYNLGESFTAARMIDNSKRYNICNLNLLGDPSMPIWTHPPSTFLVSYDTLITNGETEFTVIVRDSATGAYMNDVLVCLQKERGDYATGRTIDGGVTFNFTPDTPGTLWVTATGYCLDVQGEKRDYLPYQGYAKVITAPTACLYQSGLRIDDGETANSEGNGDGKVDVGESIGLGITLLNSGSAPAEDVIATLSSESPYITITDSSKSFSTILPGDSAISVGDFGFQISVDYPHDANSILPFTLNIRDSNDSTWLDKFYLTVFWPELLHSGHIIDDGGNGIAEPGETIEFHPEVTNTESGVARGVWAKLSSNSEQITIISGSLYLGEIPPRLPAQGKKGRLRFSLSSNYDPEDDSLTLSLEDYYGERWIHRFELSPPLWVINLQALAGPDGSIDLLWTPLWTDDLAGYNLYRSDSSAGPFSRLNPFLITSPSFEDRSLGGKTRAFYRVTTLDYSANESAPKEVLGIVNPPFQQGWPQRLGQEGMNHSSPAVAGVGDSSVICFAMDKAIYLLSSSGKVMPGWPKILPQKAESSPALADLNRDGKLEVVVNGDQTDTLYIWDLMGNPAPPGPIHTLGWSSAPPVIYDLDKDGDLEILSSEGSRLYALGPNGEILPGWPVTLAGAVNPPAVGDLDSDSIPEIAVSTNDREGHIYLLDVNGDTLWTHTTEGYNNIPPILGDVDRDGNLEVILANLTSHEIYVWRANGSLLDGWPSYLWHREDIGGPPALGDVSGDDHLELVVGTYTGEDGHLWCLNWRGNLLFCREIGDICSPSVIGDIDGDNQPEIIVASADQRVYGFEGNGVNALGFPILTNGGFYSSPVITDVDKDGDVEIVALNSQGKIFVWDLPGSYNSDNTEWGMYMHDIYHSGCYSFDPFNAVNGPKGEDHKLPQRVTLSQNWPNPFNANTAIGYQLSAVSSQESAISGQQSAVSLKIYNILGKEVRTLVNQRQRSGFYRVVWDGKDKGGRDVSSGIYFYQLRVGRFSQTRKMLLLR